MQAKRIKNTAIIELSIDTPQFTTKMVAKKKTNPKVRNWKRLETPYMKPDRMLFFARRLKI